VVFLPCLTADLVLKKTIIVDIRFRRLVWMMLVHFFRISDPDFTILRLDFRGNIGKFAEADLRLMLRLIKKVAGKNSTA
jgi:hypothetical protein